MWYQAIAGGLVMVGAYGFGLALCQDIRCLLFHLEQQKHMLLYFERETDFLHRPIQESFEVIADRLSTPYKEFALGITSAMKNADGRGFREIWEMCLEEYSKQNGYPKKAMEYLKRIGTGIGSEEDTLQIELCVMLRSEIEEEIEKIKQEQTQKRRVIHTLSLVGGILCIVIFI